MGANGVAFVAGEQHPNAAFADEYVEMIQPEVDQHLLELPVRIDRAVKLPFDQLLGHELLGRTHAERLAPERLGKTLRLDLRTAEDLLALVGIERVEHRHLLFVGSALNHLQLFRCQQFVQRRIEAPHLHLASLRLLLSGPDRLRLEFGQAFEHLWRQHRQHLATRLRRQASQDPLSIGERGIGEPRQQLRRHWRGRGRRR